jgi:Secretion system C-terminal sorting domain
MLKLYYTFFFSLICSFTFAQSNPNFEQWTNVQTWEAPIAWQTNNLQFFISVSKSFDAQSGMYAANLISNGPSFEGPAPGWMKTSFVPLTPCDTLYYHLKIDSIDSPGVVGVSIKGFHGGAVLFSNTVNYANETTNYNQYALPTLNQSTLAVDSIQLVFMAKSINSALGYYGHVEFKVDAVSCSNVLSLNDLSNQEANFFPYPNPTDDLFYIESRDGATIGEEISIFNLEGREIYRDNLTSNHSISTSDWASGIYFVRIGAFQGKLIVK